MSYNGSYDEQFVFEMITFCLKYCVMVNILCSTLHFNFKKNLKLRTKF